MDLRVNPSNNKSTTDNEKSNYDKFESEFKNTIFGVLFVLLKDEEMSIYGAFIIAIIQFLQILSFPFHLQIYDVWNSPTISGSIETVIEYLQLVYYFKTQTWDLYIIVFYVCIFIVAFALLDVAYISYSYNRKKFTFVWPLHALRIIFSLFISVLFLPLLGYFVSVLNCIYDDTKGIYVHEYFTEVQCWSQVYILHGICAITISILFVVICFVVSLTYFECRSASSDPTARANSRGNFLILLYETIMVLSLTFMHGEQYQYIILAELLGGSTTLFIKFHLNSPFYNENMAKLWSSLMAINLWTVVMLTFSKIMENTLFAGSIIAWMMGIPFVILIVITSRDHRIDLLLTNMNKFQDGDQIQNQIRYILNLMAWQSTNRNASILLDGFMEIHRQTCNKDNCPLKQKIVKNNRLTKSLLHGNDDILNEKNALLIQLVHKMFPNNTSLRVAYSFFLLEKMNNKQQAIQELGQTEQNKPQFDEQFIIYRYKKIIEDEIAESQNEGNGLDVVSEITFQNHLHQCQANIEKASLLHMEFWSQLSEDNPDLAKLNDIGSKINASVGYVEEHWNKLQKINTNMPKAMRLYGKFLIEILNDKEGGEELLERARNIINLNSNKRANNMITMVGNDDFAHEATPTIFMSGEQDKFCMITNINIAAASMFGYNKTELINRKVNVLMPQIYGKFHDSFVENYLNSNENKLVNTNKEKFVFGKSKSNYIFPIYLIIKAVPSILQGIQFIASFKQEKTFKNIAYVLASGDGTIDSISSSCINLLRIDLKFIMQKKSNIQDFIPNILKDRSSLFNLSAGHAKSSAAVTFYHPKDSDYLQEGVENTSQLQCFLSELIFLSGRENAGFQFKFEKIVDKNTSMITGDRKAKISNFQFRYDRNKPNIIGEYVEGSTNDEMASLQIDQSQYQGDDSFRSPMGETIENDGLEHDAPSSFFRRNPFQQQQVVKPQEIVNKKINYGEGIKIMRLSDGKPCEIEDAKGDDNSEHGEENEKDALARQEKNEQMKSTVVEDNNEDISFKEFNTTFKSRRALNAIINDRTQPSSIRNLKITANLLIVILFTIASVAYFITTREFDDIQGNLELIDLSNKRIGELQNILSKVRDLNLMQIGLYNQTYQTSASLQQAIGDSLIAVEDIQQRLQLQSTALSAAHQRLLSQPVIPVQFQISTGQTQILYYNLDEATQQLISKAFNLRNANLSVITSTNNDYYFVTYNLFNEYYEALRNSSEFYVDELKDSCSQKENIFLLLIIISGLLLGLSICILFPLLYKVNQTREKVLSLFLDIPEKTVKSLFSKCENFISNLQIGEEEDLISEIEEVSFEKAHEDIDNQDFHPRKRRKKFKNSGKSQRYTFLKFLFGACVIEAFFIFNYFQSINLIANINLITDEYNSTSMADSFYSFANNVERQLIVNNTFPVMNSNSSDIAMNNIKIMYALDSIVHQDHSLNMKVHSDIYTDVFNQIMMQNPCLLFAENFNVVNDTCVNYAEGAIYQGMAVDLTRHFENLRYLLTLYIKYNNYSNATFDNMATIAYVNISGNTKQKNNELNILNLPQAFEADTTQHTYIKYTFQLLMTAFQNGLNDDFNTNTTQRLIFYIFYNVILTVLYFMFWLPLVSKLNKDIWRTKSMLTMIPLNIVAKIKSIRIFLRKFLNERSSAA